MSELLATPLRLFTPAEDSSWSQSVLTARELQIIKDIASRNKMAIRVDEKLGKVFLGRAQQQATSGSIESKVEPFAQRNSISCGQTAVAMAINSLTGKAWRDNNFDATYGFELLRGLREQTPGWHWTDRDFNPGLWPKIEAGILAGAGTIIALNGPEFSPSGYGHILLIVGFTPTHVRLADPATGKFRTVAKSLVESCPPHRQGKWCFTPARAA